jgi:hypothetical protein
MGGVSGSNHLQVQVGTYRNKPVFKPLCHPDELGYMWSREVFDRLVASTDGLLPCTACIRTLERDKAMAELEQARALIAHLQGETAPHDPELIIGELVLGLFTPSDKVWPDCAKAVAQACAGDDPERMGFALEAAEQFGAMSLPDTGLVVFKEQDLYGMMRALSVRSPEERGQGKGE